MGHFFINHFSFWEIIGILIVAIASISFMATWVSSFFFEQPISADHRKMADTIISVLGGGFSLLLAFVIVNSWNFQLRIVQSVAEEADNAALILRHAAGLTPPGNQAITQAITDYIIYVRTDEWKAMRVGREGEKSEMYIGNLFTALHAYQPQPGQDSTYYSAIMGDVTNLLKSRRDRLLGIQSVLPEQIQTALFIAALLIIIIAGISRGERHFYSSFPTLCFAVILGFNLGLAANLLYPFSGNFSISNHVFYEGALAKLTSSP